jgi:spermidine/putrescine transport system permease protein
MNMHRILCRIGDGFGRFFLLLVLFFLYVPIFVLALMSFNESMHYQLPFEFSTRWYVDLASNERLLTASVNSVLLALVNTVIATTLGTMAAYAFARFRFKGRNLMQLLLLPPITIPWLIIGVSMLVLFFWTGVGRGLHAMLLGHVALQSFLRVSVPVMAPSIVAASLFAFAVSFDQFVISYFLAAPGISVLPVEIFSAIRKGFTPEVNAISTIMIVVSMAAFLLFARISRFGGER